MEQGVGMVEEEQSDNKNSDDSYLDYSLIVCIGGRSLMHLDI